MSDKDLIREFFEYDPNHQTFLKWKKVKSGGVYTYPDKNGYLVFKTKIVTGKSKVFKVHRIIADLIFDQELTNKIVEHLDGNVANNQIDNLRLTDHSTNMKNKSFYKNNTSGFTGVIERKYSFNSRWYDENGKLREKAFSKNKYGLDQAFEMACNYRKSQITGLNEFFGEKGYTDRHGGSDE